MKSRSDALFAEALQRCANEPIQYIGAIQSHGVLIAVDRAEVVRVASENLYDILGISAVDALNQPAEKVFGAAGWATIRAAISTLPSAEQPGPSGQPLALVLTLGSGETRVDREAQIHRVDDLLIVEIEAGNTKAGRVRPIDLDATNTLMSALLGDVVGLEDYATIVADQVQTLTGFDRVMVYQFDAQWNGKIIAESRNDGVASFLGNHFPASDIPPPARELYTKNLVRILVDRDAPAVPLIQAAALAVGRSLDLSFSLLRSMAPVHLEYLRNLGVRATLSVSLMQNGRLWGLIACHHERPRQLTFRLRQALDLVARAVAIRLSAIAFIASSKYHSKVRDMLPRLVGIVQGGPDGAMLDADLQREVLAIVQANGAIIAAGTLTAEIGITPSPEQVQALLAWLRSRLAQDKVIETHALARDYPAAAEFAAIASGLLAIRLDDRAEQVLLWFREETVRSIPWAGEAAKYLVEDERGPRLDPRRSFKLWVETQRGESLPWSESEIDAAHTLSITLAELFARQQLKRVDADLRIAATAFESQEGMLITNAQGVVLRINRAFTEITGYAAQEVVGHNPRLLHSGRQDAAFYAVMWGTIGRSGSWRGEIWNRRKNGEAYPEWLSISAVKDSDGHVSHYVGTFTDITQRKTAEDEIKHLAFYDQLTELPNRRLMMDRLERALASSARQRRQGALMLIDVDNFKTLNDTFGHAVGDQLLIEAAARLTACIRAGDTVARLGGDEFVVILEDLDPGPQAAVQAESVATKIHARLGQPYLLAVTLDEQGASTYNHHCTSSTGITLFSNRSVSVDELMKRVDTAMYRAKAAGRDTLLFFDPEMQASVKMRAAAEADLRKAVEYEQFLLYYQPQVDRSGRVTGAEALVRWQHPVRGMVAPAEFIPLAEETGLILPLGHWVMHTACAQLSAWAKRPDTADLVLAVNVSARQFALPNFVDEVLALIDRSGARPDRLKLELTESLLLDNAEDIIAKMHALKARGVSFSLDDFGTGYSSLSYLKRLPLDQLKIDQSFVRDILIDPNDAVIARTVVALGESLGLSVIAEGVETSAQRDLLAKNGCFAYQGYLFSRPLALAAYEAFLRSNNSLAEHPES
jgi:diguanylate cyclase (GGDEF)-like protein/PAS domain S-box-containing protein